MTFIKSLARLLLILLLLQTLLATPVQAGWIAPDSLKPNQLPAPVQKALPAIYSIASDCIGTAYSVATAAGAGAAISGAVGGVGGFTAGAFTAAGISTVSAAAGSIVGTTIATGSLSQGLQAGANALSPSSFGRNLVTAIVPVGLNQIGFTPDAVASTLGLTEPNGVITGVGRTVGNIVTNTVSGTLTATIIDGGNVGRNLVQSALNSVSTELGQIGAGAIADGQLPPLATELAHGALGCTTASIRGQDCAAGAVGAIAGHTGAGMLDTSGIGQRLNDQDLAFWSSTIGGTVAAATGDKGDLQQNFGTGQTTAQNAVENNYLTTSPFREVRRIVNQENARLMNECGSSCTEADFRRIDQQMATLEVAANLAAINQRGGLSTEQAQQLAQFAMELMPITGSAESLAQLLTGRQTLTGEEASRFWASVGLVPVAGGMVARVGNTAMDVAHALRAADAAPGLVTDANRLLRQYVSDIETQTGYRLNTAQREALANELRTGNHAVTLTPAENAALRNEFNNARPQLIAQWEANTGEKWPQVEVIRNGQATTQNAPAHHVIPVQNNGPAQWWNITPAPQPGHSLRKVCTTPAVAGVVMRDFRWR